MSASQPTTKQRLPSKRTPKYKKMEAELPAHIFELSEKLFEVFDANPNDPRIDSHPLDDTRKGRHKKGSVAVEITKRWRAIYVIDNGENGDEELQYCWYWVGSHEKYNNFVGT